MKGAALEAFKRYWANPSYGLPRVPGVFGMATLGDVDFFLLDNRFYRYPNRYPPVAEKTMFGAAQLEWLRQALVASRATFKVIVAGGQFWNRRNRYESFRNFPAEQRALAEWLAERRIEGVLFLSGDRHFSAALARGAAGHVSALRVHVVAAHRRPVPRSPRGGTREPGGRCRGRS